MKIKLMTTKHDRSATGRGNPMAWLLLLLFSLEIMLPSYSYAGGPTQPEVSGFTPIGMSDMVDPFTGDFSYNIPLMDVEGYPLNIAYNAGIGMDQESSWVGLGWNLNVGSVVRNLRGLPDDFDGDQVVKIMNMKPNRSYSLDVKAGDIEIFGKKPPKNTPPPPPPTTPTDHNNSYLNVSLGISYNNYNGYGVEFAFGPSLKFTKAAGHKLTAGFSLSGSSENGASFAPSVSYERKISAATEKDRFLNSNIGSSFNSRAGLSYVSYGVGLKKEMEKTDNKVKNAARTMTQGTLKHGMQGSFNTGLATYSPSAGPAMKTAGIVGSWKMGVDAFGTDGTLAFSLGFSSQWIAKEDRKLVSPAYGYFNLDKGQSYSKALLDFNRDNDGSFTKYTPNLPTAYLTYDIYSLNAQGISGSYRGFRNDVGYVFDPEVRTVSNTGDVGLETGLGAVAKFGLDVSYNHSGSVTGGWDGSLNHAAGGFKFSSASAIMQEANERSVDGDRFFYDELNGSETVAFKLGGYGKFASLKDELYHNDQLVKTDPSNLRKEKYKRNQTMQFLSHGDLQKGFGISALHPDAYAAPTHHVGEIIQTGTDGRRYVFGIAAYNQFQEEVTFATGKRIDGSGALAAADDYDGLIGYTAGKDVSEDNDHGLDNYYSSTTTPAYAHSHLLTAVLSDDYIDADDVQGPSKNDAGTYVKFGYEKLAGYEWRTPMENKQAFRNEGMKTDPTDDKASFIYGKKDLWYVKVIETKNYVAVFELEKRADGFGVSGRDGGVTASNMSTRLLRKISLYTRPDYQANGSSAVAVQEVHFVYSYELCPGYPGNPGGFTGSGIDAAGTGKLTLKQIYFTYQGSKRMKYSPYRFEYNSVNPSYNMKATDRWGNYKAVAGSGAEAPLSMPLNNADYPYTDQHKANTDAWAAAWSMTDIGLPSGGRIHVDYESDDYQYVQHKKAMRMFKIVSTEEKVSDAATNYSGHELHSVSDSDNKNRKVYFRMEPHTSVSQYAKEGSYVYFRCLTEFLDELDADNKYKYDFVSGYGLVKKLGTETWNGETLGYVEFDGKQLKDVGAAEYSPITKAAIQFGRLHLSRYISDAGQNDPSGDNSEQGLLDFAQAAYNGLASFQELFTGPNMAIYHMKRGRKIVTNKSWLRLQEPDGIKLGGGLRVKRILMSDEWASMTSNLVNTFQYGQEYTYRHTDGTSSGVATYEPQAGGDENPWRQPEMYHNKLLFAPDMSLYQEEPLAESQFPSPSVGYARVEIRDLKREGVVRTATGKVVKEFFTARDFPTIVTRTDLEVKTANSFLPLLPKYQYLSASQGFTIELNDMHGKPSKESVYPENIETPISTVEYIYKEAPLNTSEGTRRLTNQVRVVYPNGTTGHSEIGVKKEAAADFRKSRTSNIGGAIEFNANVIMFGPIPVPIPTAWPSIQASDNEFKSATLTKVINRFGILEKTIADQDGSKVETANLAYDAETGEVLVTQTATNFNDKVYSMNYPAYWAYGQLGPAYKTLGEKREYLIFNTSGYAQIPNAQWYFSEGDELMIQSPSSSVKGWVSFAGASGINVIDKQGNAVEMSNATITVIRSGRKNKQATSMASLTSLADPLAGLGSNTYRNVLNAGAIEFSQLWNTPCNCLDPGRATTNPYVLGTKGNWRPARSYTHLTERTQSSFDHNTNIRKDGVFKSYTPYYSLKSGQWTKQPQNWTFVSEVTQFSPNGMTLETRDALGRSSASLYGFNGTLTTAVSANASLRDIVSVSFEDNDYSNCADPQFLKGGTEVVSYESHTGRKSIKVSAGHPLSFETNDLSCRPRSCTVGLRQIENTYYVSGGTAPYTMEFDVISGDADAILVPSDNNRILFFDNASMGFSIRITITDASGCQYTQIINDIAR